MPKVVLGVSHLYAADGFSRRHFQMHCFFVVGEKAYYLLNSKNVKSMMQQDQVKGRPYTSIIHLKYKKVHGLLTNTKDNTKKEKAVSLFSIVDLCNCCKS